MDLEIYKEWSAAHASVCNINHIGSAERMEKEAASDIFLRSVEKRKLIYNIFVGDRDAASFASVKVACYEKFGDVYTVQKEECVGHIQKRMGSALREYKRKMHSIKLKDGKGVGGSGRLTDKMCDRMQNNFGEAIRNNIGDKDGMYNAIWAIFKHMVINPGETLEEQHNLCPRDGWCLFWKSPQNYIEKKGLPHVFVEELTPLFTRLTEENLLNRCLQGLTQNQNEAANHLLWSKCPKTKFCGRQKILPAVSETIGEFNTGAASKAMVLKSSGVAPHHNMLSALRNADKIRIKKAAIKISEKARHARRKLRAKRKSKVTDKISYMAGGFGLSEDPEDFTSVKKSGARKRKTIKIHVQPVMLPPVDTVNDITFVDDNDIHIWIKNWTE